MSFLQTTFKTGYITDLILPPPPEGKTPTDVFRAGHSLALEMARSPETMSKLNPFVYSVRVISADDPQAVDVDAVAARFGVEVSPTPSAPPSSSQSVGDFVQYEIKDKLPVAFGFSADMTYHSAIRTTQQGIEALTDPGSGVLLHGKWGIEVAQGPDERGSANADADAHARTGSFDATAAGIADPRAGSAGGATGTGSGSGADGGVGGTGSGGTGSGITGSGRLHLLETNTTSCSVLVAWYIKASMDKAHRTAHRRFKDRWVQRMKEMGYPCS
ncbi:hypothetical protein HRR83_007693 [Exophiala dermatitidis]|uniref:DUF7053 domain-containing protein n=1 Tax=Exophiala dermatitidis TaxID=5970 RepID=A0AAN6ERR1_EXODE|nr:hypothetical protein HRR73_008938 [Exophiala dermatitidis]KAJ4507780.1 hypothetical protein HRR75_006490 [Exophiala dermatitidis]KAJ4509918.1 hypothetical protein HRR74_007070 [Exophiala dermatitidis]KAJ4539527.1 hypothetical protein HRR77_006409 [Exophiala dermatitidis]KAJ4542695.1 hypothetical protein HRR78_006784 [Exophiala dermatitidis]